VERSDAQTQRRRRFVDPEPLLIGADMNTQTRTRTPRQSGFSLAELMVAMAVLTILVLAGLTMYDRSNRIFNQGVQSSDMQQSTRVAFDKIVSDVRLAGFDYDRDGIPFSAMAPVWTLSTSYVQGNLVQPTPANGHTYICTTGGTSGASQPTFLTGNKSVTNGDNGVVWQENGIVQYQQPDEQIEYTGEAAIAIRANFDFETELGPCPASGAPKECENGREQALESTQFPVVTTDNDEIVTYALVSNSGNSSANQSPVVFYADTDRPRDVNPKTGKKENKVTITGVDTTNLYPPYTLYRYTLANDGTPVGTPIADNIRSLRFHYYTDTAGRAFNEIGCTTYIDVNGAQQPCAITTLPYGTGQYDASLPNQALPERDQRASIKSIRLELVGMNANSDADYTDTDTVAPHYRKFELDSLVVPRNIGKHGMREFSTLPPSAPTISTVCAGSCNAVYATWQAPDNGGGVDSYNILYSPGDCGGTPPTGSASCTSCPNLTYSIAEDAGTNLAQYATKITPGQWYRFSVQAVNKYGSINATNCVAVKVMNMTTPAAPSGLSATGGTDPAYPVKAGGIQLTWPPVTTNVSSATSTSCSDGSVKNETTIPWGESIAYRIWRSKTTNFTPGDPGSVQVLSETSSPQPTQSGSNLTWNDTTAPLGSCIDYHYRIQAVSVPCCSHPPYNTGGNASLAMSAFYPASNPATKGRTDTTAVPAAPTGLGIGSQNCTGNVCDVTVTWSPVTKDTNNNPMFIDGYTAKLYNSDGSYSGKSVTSSNGATSALFNNLNQMNFYSITITANDCLNSAESAPLYWPCDWSGGTISVTAPVNYGGDGTPGNPFIIQSPTSLSVTTANAILKVDGAVFEGNTQIGGTITDTGPKSAFTIPLPKTDDGVIAKVHLTLTSTTGTCALNGDYFVLDEPAPTCAIKDKQSDSTVVTSTGSSDNTGLGTWEVKLLLKNFSTDILKPKKLIVTFFAKSGTQQVNGYTVPAAAGGTITTSSVCNPPGKIGTDMITLPAGIANIAANGQIAIDLYFNGSQDPLAKPGNYSGNPPAYNGATQAEIYVEYQSPFGDILICRIYPSGGTTTEPPLACQ
jgi:prepilin-type N-terminal cleavage/methylation domain-containing protein